MESNTDFLPPFPTKFQHGKVSHSSKSPKSSPIHVARSPSMPVRVNSRTSTTVRVNSGTFALSTVLNGEKRLYYDDGSCSCKPAGYSITCAKHFFEKIVFGGIFCPTSFETGERERRLSAIKERFSMSEPKTLTSITYFDLLLATVLRKRMKELFVSLLPNPKQRHEISEGDAMEEKSGGVSIMPEIMFSASLPDAVVDDDDENDDEPSADSHDVGNNLNNANDRNNNYHLSPISPSADDDDDDASSINTVLTECSSEELEDDHHDDDMSRRKQNETLEQKVAHQEKLFEERDHLLNRLDRVQNPALMTLLRQREMIVRQQERELLLLLHLEDVNDNDDISNRGDEDDDDSVIWYDAASSELLPDELAVSKGTATTTAPAAATNSSSAAFRTLTRRLYHAAVWETRITVPAISSLLAHSLAHAGMYDVMVEVTYYLKKEMTRTMFATMPFLSDISVFLLGVAMMRSSGYLYWWLNSRDYQSIRLEMHNRLLLGDWEARLMLWIKRHTILRALLYMTGYVICYIIMFDAYEGWYYSFMKPEIEGGGVAMNDAGVSTAGDISWWNVTLSEWIERALEDPSLEPVRCVLVCGSVTISCIVFLSWYGFAFFGKY